MSCTVTVSILPVVFHSDGWVKVLMKTTKLPSWNVNYIPIVRRVSQSCRNKLLSYIFYSIKLTFFFVGIKLVINFDWYCANPWDWIFRNKFPWKCQLDGFFATGFGKGFLGTFLGTAGRGIIVVTKSVLKFIVFEALTEAKEGCPVHQIQVSWGYAKLFWGGAK